MVFSRNHPFFLHKNVFFIYISVIVNKNANNTLVMTLSEKSTLSDPYFLFEFISDVTGDSVVFLSEDLSNYTARFNEFLITETSGTTNFSSGTITLNPTGQWTYKVYEQTSSSNLIPSNADNYPTYLESGIIKVKGTSETNPRNEDNETFIVNE